MKLVIFLLLTITYTSLGFDENGDFEYFFSLDYLETPLRLAIPTLQKCFSDVQDMYKTAAETFTNTMKGEVTDIMNQVSTTDSKIQIILKPTIKGLANLTEIVNEYLPQIEGHIKNKNEFKVLATQIEKFRKGIEGLKKTYNTTLIKLKAHSISDALMIEDIMQTAYREALGKFKYSALTFEACMQTNKCK